MSQMILSPTRTRIRRKANPTSSASEEVLQPHDSTGLLGLQRSHGNQHVQRVVTDSAGVHDIVQRDPKKPQPKVTSAEDAMILGSVQFTPEDNLLLWKLAGGKNNVGTLNPLQINSQATTLLDRVKGLAATEPGWQSRLDLLGKHEGKGQGKLATVRAAAGKIGAQAQGTGGSGYYNRAATEGFIDATDEVATAYEAMLPKQKAVTIAIQTINKLSLEKRKKGVQKEEAKAAKDVADENERIAREKKYLTKVLDVAKVIADPTEWVSTAVDVAAFVGEEIIDRTYTTSYHGQLEAILDEIRGRISAIDDEIFATDMNKASLELEKATEELSNAKKIFERKIAAAKRKETTVVEAYRGSRATKGAGDAVAERGKVVETAREASKLIGQWLEDAEKANGNIGYLDRFYDLVVDGIGYERTSIARNEKEAKEITYFSTENGKEIRDVGIWLRGTMSEAHGAMSYIAEGSFLKGYDSIPDALSDALVNRNAPKKKGS